jgi:exopolyphosphatase/guanosine-5'-triphosphate,3'-diphosphate pyrophosphatase
VNRPTDSNERPRLAAIDIGTNTIRLVVVEVENGTFRVLDEEREATRLGHGLYETGRLGDEPMERSLDALGRMKAIADGLKVSEVRAIATAAVREATNGRTFRRRAERRHGLRIQVISSRQEARFAYLSMVRRFNLDGRPVAMVDIGGGSVELVLAAGSVVERIYSLPLGAVRLTEQHVTTDPISKSEWKALTKQIDRQIEQAVGKPPFKAPIMLGSGGTFTTLAAMIKSEKEGLEGSVQGYPIGLADVANLLTRLRTTPLAERRQLTGVNADRADIIVAGVTVISRLARWLGCDEIRANEGGIREGLLMSIIAERGEGEAAERAEVTDRMEWVRRFAHKCHSNVAHCEHVAKLATQLFDGLEETYGLPRDRREILQAAAYLHDIGYLVGHAKHHKHAYHLIMHGDLPAYSAREVELIANIARYHRRAYPKKKHQNFARLSKPDRKLVRQLSGILRIADGLDRTQTQAVTRLDCQVKKKSVRILVTADAPPQVELWDANRKAGLFEKVFERTVKLEWKAPKEQFVPESEDGRRLIKIVS